MGLILSDIDSMCYVEIMEVIWVLGTKILSSGVKNERKLNYLKK